MGTPTNSPLSNPHPGLEGTILPTGSSSGLSSSLRYAQLPGKPRQSFPSQVPRSLAAKARPEAGLRRVRSQDPVILLVAGNAPKRQGGSPEKETCGVSWRVGRGQTGAAVILSCQGEQGLEAAAKAGWCVFKPPLAA